MRESIIELRDAEPFVPFRITLTRGESFDILAPGLLAEGNSQFVYCFPKSDRFAILRLNQVASVATLNGRTHGRGRTRSR